MTVSELYTLTKTVMHERMNSTIYDQYLIGNLNTIIMELYAENNMARVFKGKDELRTVPFVTSLTDEILYEDEYAYTAMPYGLASRFFVDDDLGRYSLYKTEYNNARVKAQKLIPQEKYDAVDE